MPDIYLFKNNDLSVLGNCALIKHWSKQLRIGLINVNRTDQSQIKVKRFTQQHDFFAPQYFY